MCRGGDRNQEPRACDQMLLMEPETVIFCAPAVVTRGLSPLLRDDRLTLLPDDRLTLLSDDPPTVESGFQGLDDSP